MDDDLRLLDLIREVLVEDGYEVMTSDHPGAAYAFVKACQPRLLILDLVENGKMVGAEALRRIKADPTMQGVPVIVSSALGLTGDLASLPAVHDLAKPFDVKSLLQAVRSAIREPARPTG